MMGTVGVPVVVKFLYPENGYRSEQFINDRLGLKLGRSYLLERMVVHGFHTEYFLVEFPDISFNSVFFEREGIKS